MDPQERRPRKPRERNMGPDIEGMTMYRRLRRPTGKKRPLAGQSTLNLPTQLDERIAKQQEAVGSDMTSTEIDDVLDIFPASTPIYGQLPAVKGPNSHLVNLFVGFLPSRQALIPVADENGEIQGESERGTLVHYIGIEDIKKVNSGWLQYDKRVVKNTNGK